MKTKSLFFSLTLVLLASFTQAEPLGTAFTYQGRLSSSSPANGTVAVTFSLWDAASGGNNVGTPLSLNRNAQVANWVFAVDLDFGAAAFSGDARWLEIQVNGVLQGTRTRFTPAPNAIYASTAGTVKSGGFQATQLGTAGALAGQFLSYNGSSLFWQTPPSGLWQQSSGTIYYNAGNVGIGTANPQSRLHVVGDISLGNSLLSQDQGGAIELGHSLGNGNRPYLDFHYGVGADQDFNVRLINDADKQLSLNGSLKLVDGLNGFVYSGSSSLSPDQGGAISLGNSRGTGNTPYLDFHRGVGADQVFNVRLINDADKQLSLHGSLKLVNGLDGFVHWGSSSLSPDQGGAISLENSRGNGNTPYLDFHYGVGRDEDFNVRLINDADKQLTLNGNFRVRVLTITGGGDLAEPFPMKEETIEKGSVVVIDEEHPGRLKLSMRAYDTQVAGIVSGANGINPGIALKQEGALDQGQNVALTGRVYVKADASFGAIKPGDLLTTSDTPGHAMKVTDHTKSQGAILGKAMSALQEGTGLVLVLVTLQ